MQAKYLVVDESRNERSLLVNNVERKSLSELLEIDDNSSVFDTEDQQEFLDKLIKEDYRIK
jgi:hypothetical protein